MSSTKRPSWTALLIIAGGLIGVAFFWEPLLNWFSPQDESSQKTKVSSHVHVPSPTTPEMQPRHAFDEAGLAALKEVFSAYDVIRAALASDQYEPVPAGSARLQTALELLLSKDPQGLPSTVRTALEDAKRSAQTIANQGTLSEARKPFGELSKTLFQLAESDPRLQEGWHVFRCPMEKNFPKWFQASDTLENPYMGQQMLACGNPSEWTIHEPKPEPLPNEHEVAHWTCSMHPSVRQSTPGTCPICSMDLTPVTYEALRTGDVRVDSVRRQQIGVRTGVAAKRHLIRHIRAVGRITYDESRVYDVTTRTGGWVEALQVKRTGDGVKRNATLLEFYSPELLATQRELLAAPSGSKLAAATRERLRLWGMSSWEIQEMLRKGSPRERVSLRAPQAGIVIEKHVYEGAHVRAGQLLYRIADLHHVWLEVDVFEPDLRHVKAGQVVHIELPHTSIPAITAEIAYVYPYLDPSTRTGKARIELSNQSGALRPEMFANVIFDLALGEHLAIPTEAILISGPRRLVFVDKGEGRLRPVEVQVGPRGGEWTAIEKGLVVGDVVVTSGAFLIAAESRIQSATNYWEAGDEAE